VDGTGQIGLKRQALACHASQPDAQGMLAAGDEEFAGLFGWEFYLEPGRPAGMVRGWPF